MDDIVDGIESAMRYLERSTGTYEIVNLGGARTITLRDMIVHVATALGVSPQIENLCEPAGDVRRTFVDVSKAQRLFGYRPSVSFEDGPRRFAEWFLSERACAGVFA